MPDWRRWTSHMATTIPRPPGFLSMETHKVHDVQVTHTGRRHQDPGSGDTCPWYDYPFWTSLRMYAWILWCMDCGNERDSEHLLKMSTIFINKSHINTAFDIFSFFPALLHSSPSSGLSLYFRTQVPMQFLFILTNQQVKFVHDI